MATPNRFVESPDGTREEMLRATYIALGEHGYADLTVERIGEQFPKSKSLIYHHYDGKDELLLDFLEFMLERFEGTMPFDGADSAEERLENVLHHVLATPLSDDRRQFARAMVELRAQAAHDERYRDHFTRHDRFFRDELAATIEAGVEEGSFGDVDADAVAWFLVTVINGSMTQRVTSDDETTERVRDLLVRFLRTLTTGER